MMKNNTTKIQSAWVEQLQQNQKNLVLARALWQNGRLLYNRFQNSYQQLLALPRKWRRAIQRKVAPSLAAAALMLALGTFPIHAVPMATITVDDVICSLADAITAANTDTATNGCTAGTGADVLEIQLDLNLTAVLPDITTDITINGNNYSIQGDDTFRLFTVAASGDLTVNDATVSKGFSAANGGGFYNDGGTLTLNNSVISGNNAVRGDAIAMNNATVTINDSSVSNNGDYALYGQFNDVSISNSIISGNAGRASYLVDTNLTVNDSTISGNGTGLYIVDGTAVINNSTISGNAQIGLHLYKGNFTINNSTISGNGTRGVYGRDVDATFSNSTISDNGTHGIETIEGANITLNRTIVSGNTSNEVLSDNSLDANTVNGDNYNVIGYGGSARSTNFTPNGSDIIPADALNTVLDTTLSNNGGTTYTHDLIPGSIAIDAAPSGACVMSPINQLDQRGYGRLVDGDATDSTLECDVGAVEHEATPAAFPIHEARLNGVDCALSDAITAANTDTAVGDCAAGTGDDTILLLKNSVISGSALPAISTSMTIDGANYLITGSYSYQLLDVSVSGDLTLNDVDLMGGNTAADGGIIDNSGTVAVNDSIVTRGYAANTGGGIRNQGSFTLTNSSVDNNYSANDGGGIYNNDTLTVNGSIISGNNSNLIRDGGGLYTKNGTVELNNSTISGNMAGNGDGIYVESGDVTFNSGSINGNGKYAIYIVGGTVTFNNSTISGNTGRVSYINGGLTTFNNSTISGNDKGLYFGSGIGTGVINNSTITGNNGIGLDVYKGNVTLNRTIISGNNQEVRRIALGYGSITGGNFNVIGYNNDDRSTNFTPSGSDIVPVYALDTVLDSTLADNGGATLTHALVPGSPAIDKVNYADCSTTDQRGMDRRDGDGDSTADCDIGAYEGGTMQCGVSAGNDYPFVEESGVSFHVNAVADADVECLYVEEVPASHPDATGTDGTHLHTGKFWRLKAFQSNKSTSAATFDLNITLPFASASGTTRACKWLEDTGAGYGWDCFSDEMPTTNTATSVTRQNVTELSDWAVGDNVGPTAVSLQTFTANATPIKPTSTLLAFASLMLISLRGWYKKANN